MQNKSYPWLNSIYTEIINNYKKKKLHHTILIESYNINNTYKIIWAISKWIFCKNKYHIKNCGKCTGCILIKQKNHPDFYILHPNNTSKIIEIEQIRNILYAIQSTSQYNNAKVIWIPNYKTLTIFSINALLKVIEEPPKNTFFFIGNTFYKKVHLTFQSRCLLYKINIPTTKVGLFWIQKNTKFSKQKCLIALHINNNDPELAKKLLEKYWKQRNQLYQNIQMATIKNNFLILLPQINTKNILNKIYWIIVLLLDSLKFKKNISYLMNTDYINLIRKISKKYSFDNLHNILKSWIICRYLLRKIENIDSELLILKQLLKWQILN
ncbi:DNA polymerase III subunit delta' C-terminal domain-containing protein [Buchnera aphidicola]|uniref:DNA polymerase III subunit delta n=1 Tax=Buchnera aphidicola (Sarucallis kahawaluokalani) TaxID=1241878 RepID=A0A4D6YD37_9GAMM|nr:DNA polymerase III subunit delta' C-terminal domain-containing protein [Buchnera aphidicola]QCI26033.1 DNA polymerase III subunit delta' [Buchnera aphidicola (Sarucallis kahawaluokalani)]